jgi:type I restriction enzyme R subunit
MVKEWRNEESHISPTASEQELEGAIKIIVTMYCYATGMCITDLEMADHDIEEEPEKKMAAETPEE